MIRKITIFCGIVAVSLISCNAKTEVFEMDNITIKVEPEKARKILNASEVYSQIEYIILETNEESILGEITRMIIHNDRFYILDRTHSQAVFCFDKNGNFLFKIDRRGGGPGEYRKLTSISIDYDKNHLLLHDNAMQQILSFDFEGNYLKTAKLGFHAPSFTYIGKGNSAFHCQYIENPDLKTKKSFPNLIITNGEDFDIIHQKMYFPESYNTSAILNLMNYTFSKVSESITSMISIYNDTVYYLSEGRLSYAYYIDFGRNNKTLSKLFNQLNNKKTDFDQISKYIAENDICSMIHFVETSDQIFIVYSRGSDFHYAYYKKDSNELIDVSQTLDNLRINKWPFHNDLDGGVFPYPGYSDGTSFYSLIHPYQALNEENNKFSNSLIEVLGKVSLYDNPIIVKMTPKK